MDGNHSINIVDNTTGDLIIGTAEPSISAPLHVTFDEPLSTVYREIEEGEVVTDSEPEVQEQTEPTTVVVGNLSMGTGDRRRSRSRSSQRRRRRSHAGRNRSRSLLNRRYYNDQSTVQITEEDPASDHRRGSGQKSREYRSTRTDHSCLRDTNRHED